MKIDPAKINFIGAHHDFEKAKSVVVKVEELTTDQFVLKICSQKRIALKGVQANHNQVFCPAKPNKKSNK
jgi:hypothetical protein